MTGSLPMPYPKPVLLITAADILAVCYLLYALNRKLCGWLRGTASHSDAPAGPLGGMLKIWLMEVFLHRQLWVLSPGRWLVHAMIFWGVLSLTALSASLFLVRNLAVLGVDYGAFGVFQGSEGSALVKIWGDGAGLVLFLGLAAAVFRRYALRPAQQITEQFDAFLLFFLLWLTLTGFALEGLRIAASASGAGRYSFVASLFVRAGTFSPHEAAPWLTALWTIHGLSGVALVVYLPHSKLIHSILAPLVIAMNAGQEHERKDLYWPDMTKHRPVRSRKT